MHAAPMYIAETTPSQIRGRFISLKEFFIVLGMLVSWLQAQFAFSWQTHEGLSNHRLFFS